MIEFDEDIPIPPTQANNMVDNDLYNSLAEMPLQASFAVTLNEDATMLADDRFNSVKTGSFRETLVRYGKKHKHRYTTRVLRQDGKWW